MKKFKIFAALLVSAFALSTTACSDDDNTETPAPPDVPKITLSISGGEKVTVDGADVTKPITITASDKSDKDILVTLTDNGSTGQVAFATNPVTIKAGKMVAEAASATFTKLGFPAGSDEKNINISISSSTANVTIGTKSTTFSVKGANGAELPNLAVTTPDGVSFNTTDGAVNAKVTFTLASALTTELPITVAYAEDSELKAPALTPVVIAAEATFATLTIPVAQGVTGTMKLVFSSTGANLDKTEQTLIFTKTDQATVSIAAKDGTSVTVPNKKDATKTITVALSIPATETTIVKLASSDQTKGELSADELTFAVGEQSKEVTITFSKDHYTSADVTAQVTVTATSDDVPVINGSIKYTVQGTTPGKTNVAVVTEGNATDITIDDVSITKTITATLAAEAEEDVVLNLALSGNELNGATITGSPITIAAGQLSGTATITFNKDIFTSASKTASVTVTTTPSQNALVTNGSAITYTVKGTDYKGPSFSITSDVPSNNGNPFFISTEDKAIPFKVSLLKPVKGETVTVYLERNGIGPAPISITQGGVEPPKGGPNDYYYVELNDVTTSVDLVLTFKAAWLAENPQPKDNALNANIVGHSTIPAAEGAGRVGPYRAYGPNE